ncbi:MAG: RNase J family beta-CASP ribonuclease [Luteitalea sp.]|nr:RNase J family beta-CASP ribonuclease [Luteitalea sp.]
MPALRGLSHGVLALPTWFELSMSVPSVDVVALGGLREFGMNMMTMSCGDTTIGIDAGVMFPEPELLGVDLIIPDLGSLQERARRLDALVLTHGHEDHIGAVPFVFRYVDGPVYGTPLALALIESKLAEHGIDARGRLVPVRPREVVEVGPFRIEFLRVTHSMPDCMALAIGTPQGLIIHTGDFKIDQTPIDGQHFDFHRFAQLGSEGVLALFGDSTNVDRPGFAGSELDVVDAFEEIFTATKGKIVVALFSSSLYRMQVIINLAAHFERKVAFVGRGVVENSEIGTRLGYLKVPPGIAIRDSEIKNHPAGEVVCLTTGSQGEALAALSRIAIDDNRHVRLAEDDTVVFSARAIPGNERAIGRVMNHIAFRGAEVIYEGLKHVHVSGHGSAEELKLMLSLVRPRYFIPIHGEYRQLARHARVATQVTGSESAVVLAGNGDVVRFDENGGSIVDKIAVGRVLIDGTLTGEVGDQVLRDRRHLAGDGLVVPVLAINRQSGTLEGVPEVITRGVVLDDVTEPLVRGAAGVVQEVVASASVEERTDIGLIKEKVRTELQRLFRRRSGRRPLVVPVVMEI